MKNLLFVRIPSFCICFTLIILADVVIGLAYGDNISPFALILAVWLLFCQLFDVLISRINFKKWSHYCVTETISLYLVSLLFYRIYFGRNFSGLQFVLFTVIFLITDSFIFWYFHRRQQIQADEINALIEQKNAAPGNPR